MFAKRHYSFVMTFRWSSKPFLLGTAYALGVQAIAHFAQWQVIVPWQPLSILGIAVAFYLGFKNNSSYDRTWEARKIWGGIVNSSRSFTSTLISSMPTYKTDYQRIVHRHIAWLHLLNFQLRLSKPWEHTQERLQEFMPDICEDTQGQLRINLRTLLSETEIEKHMHVSNMAVHCLHAQFADIAECMQAGKIDGFQAQDLRRHLSDLLAEQGRSERIKNFPFPRQYASTALWLCYVFCALMPLGMVDIFNTMPMHVQWGIMPISAGLLIWVFCLMEKIGDYSENPFEGTYNDVPISTMVRGIEIDLREMIGESDIPKPLAAVNGFQL